MIGVINFSPLVLLLMNVGFFLSFFDSFEWYPFFNAYYLVQLRINHTLPIPCQFDAPCCTINHPTHHLFSHCHWPSPESNFFLDIGSCPFSPDTFGGWNTLWIPCSNALDKWRNCAGSLVCSMCIKLSQNTSSMVQDCFTSNRFKNLLHSFAPHMLEFSSPSILLLYFPQMDAPKVFQHINERMNPLCQVLFLTPHGIIKDTMYIPFSERTALPTWFVLPDIL